MTNLFKKKPNTDTNAQTNDDKKDGTGDEEAARSETTVVIEDDTPKKVEKNQTIKISRINQNSYSCSVVNMYTCECIFFSRRRRTVVLMLMYPISFQEEKNLVYAELLLKQPTDESDGKTKIAKETTEYAEIVYADKKSDK